MKLAIHNSNSGFHPKWVSYCKENSIPFKQVDCYANNLIEQLLDCNALLWHHSHSNPKDILIARQILFALEHTGFKVFPNFKTAWHFDDKVGQKYLLEQLEIPSVPSYTFFDKKAALQWVKSTSFPKVFKLRGGAGAANVKLIKNKKQARKIINKAFGRGFKQYEAWSNLKERWYKYRKGKSTLFNLLKGVVRIVVEPSFSKIIGREKGYIYFQDFIPNNDSDIRVIIIDKKAFAIKRMVRTGDFRASGSGELYYEKNLIDERCIQVSFEANKKINSQCIAFDFVFDLNKQPLIVEISYGFSVEGYDECVGYWDANLVWHPGKFNPQGWIIASLLEK